MSKFWCIRPDNGTVTMVPADDASRELFLKLPIGKPIEVESRVPRNVRFHRMVFALVAKIAAAFDQDQEDIRHILSVRIGEYEEIVYQEPVSPVTISRAREFLRLRFQLGSVEAHDAAVEFCKAVIGETRIDRRPKSWAFAAMDEVRFKELFERLVKATYAIWGMLPSDIRREVDLMLAPDARSLPKQQKLKALPPPKEETP